MQKSGKNFLSKDIVNEPKYIFTSAFQNPHIACYEIINQYSKSIVIMMRTWQGIGQKS